MIQFLRFLEFLSPPDPLAHSHMLAGLRRLKPGLVGYDRGPACQRPSWNHCQQWMLLQRGETSVGSKRQTHFAQTRLSGRRTLHHVATIWAVGVCCRTPCPLFAYHPIPSGPLDLLPYLHTDTTCSDIHCSRYPFHRVLAICTAAPNLQKPPITIHGRALDVFSRRVVPW